VGPASPGPPPDPEPLVEPLLDPLPDPPLDPLLLPVPLEPVGPLSPSPHGFEALSPHAQQSATQNANAPFKTGKSSQTIVFDLLR
jgi:hypothetical protein